MLVARPTSWFSWSYQLLRDGEEVARLDQSMVFEDADVLVAGIPFRFDREGMTGDFTLAFEGVVIARATKRGVLSSTFDVRLSAGAPYAALVMRRAGITSNRFEVLGADGELLGSVRRTGLLRKARVDLPDTLPLGVHVFLLWLAVVMWRRSNRAS